jgi:mannose/fructose-specific phosphotransferase system component IIA
MSDTLRGVVVSHAGLAQSLVAAAEHISGVTGALVAVSNEGCDGGALKARIGDAIGAGPAVVFVDLPGGSCLTGAVRIAHDQGLGVSVVTGVNLAMLLDFVFHRDLKPADAAQRAVDAGGRAIRIPPA